MASDTYYKYQDLEKDSDKLYIIPNDIIIYLVQSQVDQIRAALTEAARAKGKLRDKNINTQNFILTDAVQSGVLLDSDVYVLVKGENPKYLGPGDSERYLDMFPKVNDANRLAQTDISYNKDDPDSLPDDRNFVKKLHKWIDLELIKKDDYNNIIMSIVRSSGSVHNDWVYSLSGEDSGRGEGEVLDIHDRRIDDPNIPLTVKGGVNVGDPDNASDRKKLSVFGETELQDGSTMGRLLDTYGEQHPMEFGHLIPNQGQYPKVYINRGEDRFNAEDWDDTDNAVEYWRYDTSGEENEWRQIAKSEIPSGASIIAVNILPDEPIENTYYAIDVQIPYYGIGFGTIEAYREIVSHTTVNADRGMVIEDGLGDYTDKVIEKHTDKGNTFDPTGTQTHQTNGFALSIHHDGAKIKGHTYIQDEGSANLFFKEDNTIYKANVSNSDGFDIVTDIKRDCWFCEITNDEENDWQYTHYCTNKDNDIEPVVDKWPGHLYYDGILKIKGHEGWKYRIYFINEQQQKDYIEYYYQNGVFFVIESQKDTASGQIYKINNDYFTSDKTLSEILTENGYLYKFKGEYTNDKNRYAERTADYPIYLVDKLTIVEGQSELSYKGHIRVRPKTNKVYQINKAYTETNQLYGLVEVRLNELDEPIPYDANTYFYWDGIKFKPITAARDTYNQKQDYGSLTIGTRAQNNEQDNDTIGKHSVEIGTDNEATGENAIANGQATIAAALNSHAEGLGTKIKSTGLLSHIEGLGDYSELVEYQEEENDFFGEGGGWPSEVSGIASHAEGYAQMVAGHYNHAEGRKNVISGQYVTAAHAEGSENTINDSANYSHAEGELNIINAGCRNVHVEGAGNIADRNYQHLSGVLSKTTHNIDEFYGNHSDNNKAKPVTFAIGGGFNSTNIVDDRLNPAKKGNIFAVTEEGDTYIAGHLEVDGTSDLSDRVTIGDDVDDHGLALEVLKHSKFDQQVTIEREKYDSVKYYLYSNNEWQEISYDEIPAGTEIVETYEWPIQDADTTKCYQLNAVSAGYRAIDALEQPYESSLKTMGTSQFADTLTIGQDGGRQYNALQKKGTFWKNIDNNEQLSTFTGLNVHGEIRNERIPENLYTAIDIQGKKVFNEFADKFWTNSSIATNTATYRGCYTKADYDPDNDGQAPNPYDTDEMAEWLNKNVTPFINGRLVEIPKYEGQPVLPTPGEQKIYVIPQTGISTQLYYIARFRDEVRQIDFGPTSLVIVPVSGSTPLDELTEIPDRCKVEGEIYKQTINSVTKYYYYVKDLNIINELPMEEVAKIPEDKQAGVIYKLPNNTYQQWIPFGWEQVEATSDQYKYWPHIQLEKFEDLPAEQNIALTVNKIYWYIDDETLQKVFNQWIYDKVDPITYWKYENNEWVEKQLSDIGPNDEIIIRDSKPSGTGDGNLIKTSAYYKIVTGDWIILPGTPDNNDYCFVQIEEPTPALPYVLFADTFELEQEDPTQIGANENYTELEGTEINGVNIITHRYKYVQIIDPVTEEVLNQSWCFEYQLNNSGFTQAQWDTINSGITIGWMEETRRLINIEQIRAITKENQIIEDLSNEITNRENAAETVANKFGDFVTKDNTIWSYNKETNTWSGDSVATVEEISGKKNFTNISGVGFNGDYLKGNDNSITFKLPTALVDGQDSGELALKKYVDNQNDSLANKFNDYVLIGNPTNSSSQDITGKKNFTNSDGIGFNGAYLKKNSSSAGTFTLPNISGGGELALKSQVDDLASSLSNNYVTKGTEQTISGFKTFNNNDGIKINNSKLKGGNTATFTLPSTGGGELALKADVPSQGSIIIRNYLKPMYAPAYRLGTKYYNYNNNPEQFSNINFKNLNYATFYLTKDGTPQSINGKEYQKYIGQGEFTICLEESTFTQNGSYVLFFEGQDLNPYTGGGLIIQHFNSVWSTASSFKDQDENQVNYAPKRDDDIIGCGWISNAGGVLKTIHFGFQIKEYWLPI